MKARLFLLWAATMSLPISVTSCGGGVPASHSTEQLRLALHEITDRAPGTVGVAFISEHDTVTVNNGVRYPMMSVFKLHEALAVADALQRRGTTTDSVLTVEAASIDRNTWSPMLETVGDGDFDITVGRLIEYAVTSSDNNASNILFERIVTPAQTDSFIRTIAPDTTFSIAYSEHEMKADHALSYLNHTSPLSAALLIKQVFETPIVSPENTEFIRKVLLSTVTGQDRIGAPIRDIPGVKFGHKTGSGYRNPAGELTAHNDVAYVELPDGTRYALAVLIRDFAGTEAEASAIMAEISSAIYDYVSSRP